VGRRPMTQATIVKVVMPQMGESLAEGTLVRWLKGLGDSVARDEPLFEISTDKVDTDVPAPVAGVLREILVQEGQTVAVGEPVALLQSVDQVTPAATPPTPEESRGDSPAAPPTAAAPPKANEPAGHFASTHTPQLVSFRRESTEPATPKRLREGGPATPERVREGGTKPVATSRSFSPTVLDTARRGGVALDALTALKGSGRGGRITKGDVERFIASRGTSAPASVRATPSSGAIDVPPEYLYHPRPDDRRVAMSPVRRRIAQHMTWSVRLSPHATAEAEVDMTAAARTIEEWRARRDRDLAAPLTYTVLAATAAVKALREFPVLNSSVVGDDLVLKPSINLGIAVALPDSDELIVPVIHRADELALDGMARAIEDLASRARRRELRPDDVQGGTFTLTNPGIFGGVRGTPILNQPQVAILGLGAIIRRPVVIDEAIGIRSIMNVSLTFDHRAADGMMAFRYLARLKQLLEEVK
jgi:pyruvate dehydrogenase E2 component (dihydrolipoamide acetyltransferase)